MFSAKKIAIRHVGAVPAIFAAAWLLVILGSVLGWWRLGPVWGPLAIASVLAVVLGVVWSRWQHEKVVREGALPQFLKRKLRETYPHLSGKDLDLVERGLRQFFLACLRSNRKHVAMPSRVVDAMWHEFILHTKAYQDWCQLALGWFLHPAPAVALGTQARSNDGLRRAWYWACRDEAIDPHAPTRLPLLFALDAKLDIENGFRYTADYRDSQRKTGSGDSSGGTYCGTSFSDGSFSGDSDCFGGVESSDGSDGGDCGGDCGGGD